MLCFDIYLNHQAGMKVFVHAFKSLLVASLSLPVGTRVLLLAHSASMIASYIASHEVFLSLFCLQPHKTIFSLQGLQAIRRISIGFQIISSFT
jgi:hypothetical protein